MVQTDNRIRLSDHFTYKKLLQFVLSPICMMIFTSIYGVIDGLFISNYVGKTEFAAVNFIMPVLMITGAFGFMLGAGGTAIVAKTLGEGKQKRANEYFSLLVAVTLIVGVVLSVIGIILLPAITRMLGAGNEMYDACVLYGRLILAGAPAFMLQNLFQSFFSTAEKPQLGFKFTVTAGVTNIILDALFVGVFKFGIVGAAVATMISQLLGAILPFIYFLRPNGSLLRLCKFGFYGKVLLKACTNGSSEFVGNISGSVVGILFNMKLLEYSGENGVSAYGVLMYVSFIYIAAFIGYSIGTAPIIGYNYGSGNTVELRNIFKKSMVMMALFGVSMTALCIVLAVPISKIFVGYDDVLMNITVSAFRLYSLSFIFTGFGIFGSSMFTALNNGGVSALLSFTRTIVFQCGSLLVLSALFGLEGIWLSMLSAEILATILTLIFCFAMKNKYHYI